MKHKHVWEPHGCTMLTEREECKICGKEKFEWFTLFIVLVLAALMLGPWIMLHAR